MRRLSHFTFGMSLPISQVEYSVVTRVEREQVLLLILISAFSIINVSVKQTTHCLSVFLSPYCITLSKQVEV